MLRRTVQDREAAAAGKGGLCEWEGLEGYAEEGRSSQTEEGRAGSCVVGQGRPCSILAEEARWEP